MSLPENSVSSSNNIDRIPILAAAVSLIGLVDAVYLTVHHLTGEQVPCSLVEGCEQVLSSKFATIGDIPLALFGALAYFSAFSLAVLAYYGNKFAWKIFGAQVGMMAAFTVWLIYLQAVVIGAFCQFCLLSALVTFTLFAIFIADYLFSRKR